MVPLSVGPEGGTLEFPNGVILEIPPGAVTETVAIKVKSLPIEQVDAILSERVNASYQIRCLGAFWAEPDGFVFNEPIVAIVPVLPLNPGEIPVQFKVDLNERKYHLAPTNLRYLGQEGVVEMEIREFSTNASGGMTADEASDYTVPPPPCCHRDPVPYDCCCTLEMYAESESSLLDGVMGTTECTIGSSTYLTAFPLCPDQPQQTSWIQETTQGCPEDLTCDIGIDPPIVNVFVCQEAKLTPSISCKYEDGAPGLFNNATFLPFWQSNNEQAATVDSVQGTVRGQSAGVAVVEARMGVPDERFTPGQATVNVRSNLRTFSVTPSSARIGLLDGVILEAEVVGSEGTLLDASTVIWSSSNPNTAFVTQETGDWTSVEGRQLGTVIITASYQYDCETVLTTAAITVEECDKISFAVNPAQATVAVGDGIILEANVLDEQNIPLDASAVTWESSDPNTAFVTQDTGDWTSVEVNQQGDPVTVTATYDDGCQTKQATAKITVLDWECIKEGSGPFGPTWTCYHSGAYKSFWYSEDDCECNCKDPKGLDPSC